MCNKCNDDPRDDIANAEAALGGLSRLLDELPHDSDMPARVLSPLVRLIHDRLDDAASSIQDYRPL